MRITVTVDGQISAEEILTLAEGIEKLERQKNNTPHSVPVMVPSEESWMGKKVKIHSRYSEAEIKELAYDASYYLEGSEVTEELGNMIKIKDDSQYWSPKIIFELVKE